MRNKRTYRYKTNIKEEKLNVHNFNTTIQNKNKNGRRFCK